MPEDPHRTYERKRGYVCTDETTLAKNAAGELTVPLFAHDGKLFYTKCGNPVIVPDDFEDDDEQFPPLPCGIVATEMTTENSVTV